MGVNINALTDIGTPDNADQLEIFDTSAGVNKKVLRSALSGTTITGSNNQVVYRDGSGNYVTNSTFGYNGTTLAIGGASFNASIRQNLRGIGTTSATFGLVLENSAGTQTWGFRDDGVITRAGNYALNITSSNNLIGVGATYTATTANYLTNIGNNTINVNSVNSRIFVGGSQNNFTNASGTLYYTILGHQNSGTVNASQSIMCIGNSNTIAATNIIFGNSNSGIGFYVGISNSGTAGSSFLDNYIFGGSNSHSGTSTTEIICVGKSNVISGIGSSPRPFIFGSGITATANAGTVMFFGRNYSYTGAVNEHMIIFDSKDASAAASGLFFRPNNAVSTTIGNNLSIGVSPTTANIGTNNIILRTANAPSATITDTFTLYSADIIAGNAAPHVRTENGAVIKIYQETTAVASAVLVGGGGTALTNTDTFDGYTLAKVVKALRNLGILQ